MFEALLEQERDSILIEEFLNRDWDREWKSRTLTSARKFYETGGDLLEEEKTKFLGMDWVSEGNHSNPLLRASISPFRPASLFLGYGDVV